MTFNTCSNGIQSEHSDYINATSVASIVAGSEPRHLDAAEDHGSDTNVLVKQNLDGLSTDEHQV